MAECLTLSVPGLYGDHHVKRVRQVLLELDGVEDVAASSMDGQIRIVYDPETVDGESLRKALADAGYEEGSRESVLATVGEGRSAWYRALLRMSHTQPIDNEMAGDFRRY